MREHPNLYSGSEAPDTAGNYPDRFIGAATDLALYRTLGIAR